MIILSVQSSERFELLPERVISAPLYAVNAPEFTITSEFIVNDALSTKIPELALSSVAPQFLTTLSLYLFVTFVAVTAL